MIINPGISMAAIFRHEKRNTSEKVILWREDENGVVDGLILDQKTGKLISAEIFSNFLRYEESADCDVLMPAPLGMAAYYEDDGHTEIVHFIQICGGTSTLLTIDSDGFLFPISPDATVLIKTPETSHEMENNL